jgi:hypothetical protein
MTFDVRDIRSPLDVYTLDNTYIGSVLRVMSEYTATFDQQSPDLQQHGPDAVDGEQLGPAPTQEIGNRGPGVQAARTRYGITADDALPLGEGDFEVGKWWGLIGRRMIPVDAVLSVSLERVVLKLRQHELSTS